MAFAPPTKNKLPSTNIAKSTWTPMNNSEANKEVRLSFKQIACSFSNAFKAWYGWPNHLFTSSHVLLLCIVILVASASLSFSSRIFYILWIKLSKAPNFCREWDVPYIITNNVRFSAIRTKIFDSSQTCRYFLCWIFSVCYRCLRNEELLSRNG